MNFIYVLALKLFKTSCITKMRWSKGILELHLFMYSPNIVTTRSSRPYGQENIYHQIKCVKTKVVSYDPQKWVLTFIYKFWYFGMDIIVPAGL